MAETLLSAYKADPNKFQNALIRDNIRCIGELAVHLGYSELSTDPNLPTQKHPNRWVRKLPTEKQIESWRKKRASRLIRSCLEDDFNHYSINCLMKWFHFMNKEKIGKWILGNSVNAFKYTDSKCTEYDEEVSGAGRNKPSWAERIGKKYQWISLYQLASKFHDNVEPQVRSADWEPLTVPLILQKERKIDPTLFYTNPPETPISKCWWIRKEIDVGTTIGLSHLEWLRLRDDLPDTRSRSAARDHASTAR